MSASAVKQIAPGLSYWIEDLHSRSPDRSGERLRVRLSRIRKSSPDAIERALAHKDADNVRAAYHRGAYWQERVAMSGGEVIIWTRCAWVRRCILHGQQPD